jgi:ParB-like chromosome segregation protein Spo0J
MRRCAGRPPVPRSRNKRGRGGRIVTVTRLAINELVPDPANARRHSQRNIDAIMASLVRFGQQKPIVVDAKNIVRAGNGTLAAAKALGWTHLNAVRSDLAAGELAAFAIVDNRTAELADWDDQLLLAALQDASAGDLGFIAEEIESLRRVTGAMDFDGEAADGMGELNEQLAEIGQRFEVVVQCGNEQQQQELYEQLSGQGWTCRLLTL